MKPIVPYPCLTRDERKSVKISYSQYPEIRRLRSIGFPLRLIGKIYKVSAYTVMCITRPDYYELMKERAKGRKSSYNKITHKNNYHDRIKNDPRFKDWVNSRLIELAVNYSKYRIK